ncbi:GMC family oxidoreductase [Paraburkholderia sp. DHOC27]|uniref:GMC family oxidoreductase n=1 Tax=Paraburkholderia sp. DHOC27 TaxID=2303330 RepID=UPI000E3BB753|nr:GMC family oxidoreductase N-terminal domain-containing protein [Paraburkholderia sp. DHOC27]RFU49575.1 GMC family oxidoreductase [Paraburkholderia sp. DHOC27]
MDTVTQEAFAAQVRHNQQEQAARITVPFDFIVCGAGTSGCVVAARLAADPTVRVLLIEAGGHDESELVQNPNCWPMTLGGAMDWGFVAQANPRLNDRAIGYSMGKVLGGGSSINVSTWSRGHRADWDFYAAAADDDAWSYRTVLDLYRNRIEQWVGAPDPDYRGQHGTVRVQPAQEPLPFSDCLMAAAESVGLTRFANANGRMMEADGGCALVDETLHNGKRQSIFRSYVYPLMTRPNLTVLSEAHVTRVLFDGRRARKVEFSYQGAVVTAEATREVVVSLGAIHTPKLLMQSGIGPADELKQADITALQILEGVGRNLHDHVAIASVWASEGDVLGSAPRSQTACFWKSRPELDSPNFYTYASSGAYLTPENAARADLPAHCWTQLIGMRPQSRGRIHLTGAAATDPVRIDANYLGDAQDMADLISGLTFAREMGSAPALAGRNGHHVAPHSFDDADLTQYIRNGLTTFWHQSGTARMGCDAMSVVDSKLRVYGVEGLRVADASILPRVTAGNTMAPCVVIGEQAAQFMLER